MRAEKIPVYAYRSGNRMTSRMSYNFERKDGELAGWVIAPFGAAVGKERGGCVLVMPEEHSEKERKAFSPHLARMHAMRGEYGLRWEENPTQKE